MSESSCVFNSVAQYFGALATESLKNAPVSFAMSGFPHVTTREPLIGFFVVVDCGEFT
jgi:hypothetical protein